MNDYMVGTIGYGVCLDNYFASRIVPEKLKAAVENIYWTKSFAPPEDCEDIAFYYATEVFCGWGDLFLSCANEVNNKNLSDILTHDDNDCGDYLYFCPDFPWFVTDSYRSITEKDVDDAIIECIQSITDMTEREIKKEIGYITCWDANLEIDNKGYNF